MESELDLVIFGSTGEGGGGSGDSEARDVEFERRVEAWSERARHRRWLFNPGQRKELERIGQTLTELIAVELSAPSESRRSAIDRVIDANPERLDEIRTTEVVTELKKILVRAADPDVIYAMAEDEGRWTKKMTSWLTWDQLFGPGDPPGLPSYQAGKQPTDEEVQATRRRLYQLLVARLDDIQVHRERTDRRKWNLINLSIVLLAILTGLGAVANALGASILLIASLAGMLGSALSGTFRARDTLVRASDIQAFTQTLPAQLLVGGAAGFAVTAFLQARLVTIAGLDLSVWQGVAAAGFLAGFSEPWFLGTVRKITTLGATVPDDSGATTAK
jgi:hypothetical protein